MEPIPQEIVQFLDANIESLEQLEILRILGEDPQVKWPTTNLAEAVQTRPQTAVQHVTALQARGLLTTIGNGADLACRYGPRTPELEQMVSRLLQVYKERPVTMIKLVYARASDSLRAFAEAFRLKKEG